MPCVRWYSASGASVVHVTPDGVEHQVVPDVEQCEPRGDIVGRVSIRTGGQFGQPGVHRFVVDQDGAVTEYEVTVIRRAMSPSLEELADMPAEVRSAVLADQRREAAERKAWERAMRDLPSTNEHTPTFTA